MKFKTLFSIFVTVIISFFLYLGVYSSFSNEAEDFNINFIGSISPNIYLENNEINSTIIGFSSTGNIDISNYKIHSLCNISSNFINKKENNYYFYIKFNNSSCSNENFYLVSENGVITKTNFKLNIFSKYKLLNKYLDYSTPILNQIIKNLEDKIENYKIFSDIDLNKNFNYNYIKKRRYYYELVYNKKIILEILEKRKNKYSVPIRGYSLPNLKTKMPNSPRPYRESYTDGIHEGWDLDAPFGQEIISLDDGIIVNIVKNFKFEDLKKINYGNNLTYEQKIKNLNILRGNQVWIKTMKGDVVFYSHLDKVYNGLEMGDIVKKGTPLGTVGISGVPDKNYSDYHLHFEVRKNPYNYNKAGKYSLVDYLKWDWYFKGKDYDYIKENQYNIFEK